MGRATRTAEVHALRQVIGSRRTGCRKGANNAQGNPTYNGAATIRRLRPRREDLGRPEANERKSRRYRNNALRSSTRHRAPSDMGAYGNKPDDTNPDVTPARRRRAVRNPSTAPTWRTMACVCCVGRTIAFRSPEGRQVREGSVLREEQPGEGSVGDLAFEGRAADLQYLAMAATEGVSFVSIRARSSRVLAGAAASPECSTRCTASRPTRRGTHTTETMRANACRSSRTKAGSGVAGARCSGGTE